jgi:AcrR family transcriptional regulator
LSNCTEKNHKKEHILKCADILFRRLGYAGTTTAAIASEACISRRAIYEFFDTKKEIYASVIAMNSYLMVDLPRPSDEDIPLFDALINIFKLDYNESYSKDRESYIRMLNRDLSDFPEVADELYSSGTINTRELVIDWFKLQVSKNKIYASDEDINDYASMLMNIVFGSLVPKRETFQRTELRYEHIKKSIKIFLAGIENWNK